MEYTPSSYRKTKPITKNEATGQFSLDLRRAVHKHIATHTVPGQV